MTESPFSDGARRREPIFFVPFVVVALVAALLAVHAVLTQSSAGAQDAAMRELAFMPARLTLWIWPDRLGGEPLEGGAKVWTLFTYALLHGSWTPCPPQFDLADRLRAAGRAPLRLGPVSRVLRVDGRRGRARALGLRPDGFLAADRRLGRRFRADGRGGAVHFPARRAARRPAGISPRLVIEAGDERPAPSLRELLRQRRAVIFIAIWMVLNFVFGAGAQALGASQAPVAWIAHVGGFVVGLLAFPLFDRRAAPSGAADRPPSAPRSADEAPSRRRRPPRRAARHRAGRRASMAISARSPRTASRSLGFSQAQASSIERASLSLAVATASSTSISPRRRRPASGRNIS